MKNLLLLAALPAALIAQQIEGIWQGTLANPNAEIQLVFKIAKNGNAYQGTFFNLANGRQFDLGAVTLQGTGVKIVIPGNGMNYEGKLEADGNSITGNLIQGTNPLPLPLKRATKETAWTIPSPPPPPTPMAANARLVFEVATIKPAPPDAKGKAFTTNGGQIAIKNRSLDELITEAYGMHPSQIVSPTNWIHTERYDIAGKPAAPGLPDAVQMKQILASLLAERFSLKFHMEERELSVYSITRGKTGQHKLKPTSVQNVTRPLGDTRGAGTYVGRNDTVADLAERLQAAVLDRPVIDRTGIAGRFDFTLEWRPDEFQFGGNAANMQKSPNVDAFPDIFTAFQQQLGLKLEATKTRIRVFVIDSAQKPSEN